MVPHTILSLSNTFVSPNELSAFLLSSSDILVSDEYTSLTIYESYAESEIDNSTVGSEDSSLYTEQLETNMSRSAVYVF